jgi:nucleoside-diphosphate-sugar epimerase
MHAAAGTGIDRFVYVSTASVFDDGVQKTGNEFFENDVPRPATVYGDTKRIAENLLLSQEKVPCTIIRHPTIYGLSPCMRWDTLMQFCVQQAKKEGVVRMFGDGSAFRPLAALSHVVAGYAHVLHSPPPSQSCFHIVSENEPIRNYLERIQQVAKECGQRISVETVEQSYVPSYRVHSSFPYTNRPEYSFELLQAIWKAAVGRNHL